MANHDEDYNAEEGMLDDEDNEEDDADVVVVGSRSRQRGSPSDRQRAALNRPLEQVYEHFGIILDANLTPEER
jgi:hypothetical protein